MTREEILDQLQLIFRSVLDNDSLIITPHLTAHDVSEWDSLNHATLVAQIQKHFQIKFSLFDVLKLKTVGDMIELIHRLTTP